MFTQEQVRGHTVCTWNIPIPRRFQLWPANHCFGKSRDHTINVHKYTMYTSVKVLCKVEHAEHHQLSTPFGALKSECLANPILSPLSHKLFTDSEGSQVRCFNDILKSEQRPSYHHCWNSVHGAGKDQLNFYIRAPYGHIIQIQV